MDLPYSFKYATSLSLCIFSAAINFLTVTQQETSKTSLHLSLCELPLHLALPLTTLLTSSFLHASRGIKFPQRN